MTFSKLAALINYFFFIAMKVRTVQVSLIKDHNFPCYWQLTVKIMEQWLSILKKQRNLYYHYLYF